MSVEIVNVANGIITMKISGKLSYPDLVAAQATAVQIFRQYGRMRILVLAKDFLGWERGGNWDDTSFTTEYDQYMEKMAIVGKKKWEDEAFMFTGKDFRQCRIEYFPPEEVAKAKAWLLENP